VVFPGRKSQGAKCGESRVGTSAIRGTMECEENKPSGRKITDLDGAYFLVLAFLWQLVECLFVFGTRQHILFCCNPGLYTFAGALLFLV
jgi:hypothetical protein